MSEWLDLMLEEIARKRREAEEALEELDRRQSEPQGDAGGEPVSGESK